MFIEAARGSLHKAKAASNRVILSRDTAQDETAEPPDSNPTPPTEVMSLERDSSHCPRCFSARSGKPHCTSCGFNLALSQSNSSALPTGIILDNGYIVGETLECGCTGISYRAYDTRAQRKVLLREFFPQALVVRGENGCEVSPKANETEAFAQERRSVYEDAVLLAQLDHENIATVQALFEANGTCYMVMPFLEGPSLEELLLENHGMLDWWEKGHALAYGLLQGVQAVHSKGLILCDITPRGIQLTAGGLLILLHVDTLHHISRPSSRRSGSAPNPGYAAPELYKGDGIMGPWTDVYAVAATIYRLLTGNMPPIATERSTNDALRPLTEIFEGKIPRAFSDCIAKALALRSADRWQTAAAFMNELLWSESEPLDVEATTTLPTPQPEPEPLPLPIPEPEPLLEPQSAAAPSRPTPIPPEPKPRTPLYYAAAIVLLVCGFALYFAFTREPSLIIAPQTSPQSPQAGDPVPMDKTTTADVIPAGKTAITDLERKQRDVPAIEEPTYKIQETKKPKAQDDDKAGTGTITIATQPWGYVLIDGENTGAVAPLLSMNLPSGRHEISLENPSILVKRNVIVTIRNKQTTKISCTPTGCKAVN